MSNISLKNYHKFFISYLRRFSSGNKSLWDESQINNVLRNYVIHHFPTNHQLLFDTVDELINLSSSGHTKDNKKSLSLIYDKILDTCCNNSVQKSVALLYLSWKTDNGDIVNLLIAKGADANTSDPDGRSCLHLSCCAGHPNNVESLLRKRGSKNGTGTFVSEHR